MGKQALEGTRQNYFMMDPLDVVIVGVDTDDGPEHPLYDPRVKDALDDNMVRNIAWQGVLEPVIVRKDGDNPQVVAGRRRVLHARAANEMLAKQGKQAIRVPVIARRGEDSAMLGIMISENEIRRDDTPLAKARKVEKLLASGMAEEECAIAFGVTAQSIKNWSKLLDCDSKVIKAVEQGKISASAATKLSSMTREEQREELESMIKSGETTVANADVKVRNTRAANSKSDDDASPINVAPGKKAIKRAIANAEDAGLDPLVVQALRWVIGELDARAIKGLTQASAPPAPKAAKGDDNDDNVVRLPPKRKGA